MLLIFSFKNSPMTPCRANPVTSVSILGMAGGTWTLRELCCIALSVSSFIHLPKCVGINIILFCARHNKKRNWRRHCSRETLMLWQNGIWKCESHKKPFWSRGRRRKWNQFSSMESVTISLCLPNQWGTSALQAMTYQPTALTFIATLSANSPHIYFNPRFGKLHPTNQSQLAACLHKQNVVRTHASLFIYVLLVAGFSPLQHSEGLGTQTIRPAEPKVYPNWLFTQEICQPLF